MKKIGLHRQRLGAGAAGPGGGAPSLFQQVLALAAGRPVFTADNHVVDGGTGKTRAFVDWNDATHVMSQPVAAQQVALPAAHADFAGALCATFSSAQWYQSTRLPASMPWLVDGSGVVAIDVFTPTSVAGVQVWLSCGFTGVVPAMLTYVNAGALVVALYRAGGASIPPNPIGAVTVAPRILQVEHGVSRSPQWYVKQTGAVAVTGAYTTAPTAGSIPESPLRLCTLANNDFPASMRWRSRSFFPLLTPTQLAIVHAWILQDCGLTP